MARSDEIKTPLNLEEKRKLPQSMKTLGFLQRGPDELSEVFPRAGQGGAEAVLTPGVLQDVPDLKHPGPFAAGDRSPQPPAHRPFETVGHLDKRHPLLIAEDAVIVQIAPEPLQRPLGILYLVGLFFLLGDFAVSQCEIIIVRGDLGENFKASASAFHAVPV